MPEKKDYDPYMCDYEREVFEMLGQEFKYSPRELKLISKFLIDLDWLIKKGKGIFTQETEYIKKKWEEIKNE